MAHILIIEDDLTLQKVYSEVLTKEGFEVTVANSGTDGLQAIAKDHVNLVLLDIMLPGGMNGFEVLSQIRKVEKNKDLPVLVMTNLSVERQTGIELGATDYVFKTDINLRDLVDKIKHYLPTT